MSKITRLGKGVRATKAEKKTNIWKWPDSNDREFNPYRFPVQLSLLKSSYPRASAPMLVNLYLFSPPTEAAEWQRNIRERCEKWDHDSVLLTRWNVMMQTRDQWSMMNACFLESSLLQSTACRWKKQYRGFTGSSAFPPAQNTCGVCRILEGHASGIFGVETRRWLFEIWILANEGLLFFGVSFHKSFCADHRIQGAYNNRSLVVSF